MKIIFSTVLFIVFSINSLSADEVVYLPNTKWDIEKGKGLFNLYCGYCHGMEGKGDGTNAVNLDPKPRDFTENKYMVTRTDKNLLDIITMGGPAVARSQFMPPFGNTLSKGEILDIIAYIRSFAPVIKGPEIAEAKKTQ